MNKKYFFYSLVILIALIFIPYKVVANTDVNWHVGNNYVYGNITKPLTNIDLTLRRYIQFDTKGGMQGLCIAGNKIIDAFVTNDSEGTTTLEIFDSDIFSSLPSGTNFEPTQVPGKLYGHANDCTYNPRTGYVMFDHDKVLHQFKIDSNNNITNETSKTVNLDGVNSIGSIAYDNDHNQYIIYEANKIHVVNSDFTSVIRTFSVDKPVTAQGISYWKDHIYFSCSELGYDDANSVQGSTYNSAEMGSNLIFVYTLTGSLEKVLYIPRNLTVENVDKLDDTSEIESVSFYDDGTMLLGYNIYYNKNDGFGNGYYKKRSFYTSNYVKNDPDLTPVPAKTVESIQVTTLPTKVNYIQNEENLNLAGGKLTVSYSDNSSEIIDLTAEGVTVTGFSNAELGEKTLTVRYEGKSTTFNVNIIERVKQITRISVKSRPTKTEYIQRYENLDLSGGEITIYYDDDTTDEMSMTNSNVTVTGFNNSQLGDITLTVGYSGHTATFTVKIVAKQIKKIEIKEMPIKTIYILNNNKEKLDLTGGKLKITYNDTSVSEINLDNDEVLKTGFDNSSLGTKTIIVTYSGKSCSFNIEIINKSVSKIEIIKAPLKTYYIKNIEDLDLTGGIIKVTYNDESTDQISMINSNITVTGFRNDELGEKTIVVNYEGATTEFNVEIINVKSEDKIVNVPDTGYMSNTILFGMIFIALGIVFIIYVSKRYKLNIQ